MLERDSSQLSLRKAAPACFSWKRPRGELLNADVLPRHLLPARQPFRNDLLRTVPAGAGPTPQGQCVLMVQPWHTLRQHYPNGAQLRVAIAERCQVSFRPCEQLAGVGAEEVAA